jgi:hypothetical protein
VLTAFPIAASRQTVAVIYYNREDAILWGLILFTTFANGATTSPVADRMGSRKPNLFVIGAMKSGTNYLRKLLNAHPAIFMCEPGEPSYFVEPRQLKTIWPRMWEHGFWQSEQQYLELFKSAGDAVILGEASTGYAKLPHVVGVVERLERFNPDARFIYVMRDPVERTLSHYWHMVRYHDERRPIAKAVKQDSQYIAFSYYAMQLRPYLERFGSDRIKTLTYESMVRSPEETMRGLYGWLGVGAEGVDMSGFVEPENVTPDIVRLSHGVPRRLRQSPLLRGILRHLPRSVQTTLRSVSDRDLSRRTVDTSAAIAFLRPIQYRQTEELAQLLGRDFPEWTTLKGAGPTATPPEGVSSDVTLDRQVHGASRRLPGKVTPLGGIGAQFPSPDAASGR